MALGWPFTTCNTTCCARLESWSGAPRIPRKEDMHLDRNGDDMIARAAIGYRDPGPISDRPVYILTLISLCNLFNLSQTRLVVPVRLLTPAPFGLPVTRQFVPMMNSSMSEYGGSRPRTSRRVSSIVQRLGKSADGCCVDID